MHSFVVDTALGPQKTVDAITAAADKGLRLAAISNAGFPKGSSLRRLTFVEADAFTDGLTAAEAAQKMLAGWPGQDGSC